MKTIVGMFDDLTQAHQAVDDLCKLGIGRGDISVITQKRDASDTTTTDRDKTHAAEGAGIGATTGAIAGGAAGILASLGLLAIPGIGPLLAAGPIVATLTGAGVGAAAGGIIGGLVGMGIPEEDAEQYEEGIRRGGTVVTAKVADERASEASAIFDRHHAVDMDHRVNEWRSAGWQPTHTASAATRTAPAGLAASRTATNVPPVTSRPAAAGTNPARRADETQRIPVVEEQLDVSKRRVQGGGVRVYARTTEQPVTEQVRLHKETVHVERNPADRPATAADLAAFKEGTVELRETSEEPVVNKKAKVTGEVVVRKDVEERTETVRDTVRRTDVKVDRLDKDRPTNTPIATPSKTGQTGAGPACNT